MAQNNVDLCNPLAVWQLFIQFLTGPAPAAAPLPPSTLPVTLRPPMLREPDLEIRPKPGTGNLLVGKPDFALDNLSVRPDAEFKVVKEFAARAGAEAFMRATPRVRMPGLLHVEMDSAGAITTLPAARSFDWRGDPDAVRTGERLSEFLTRIPLFSSLPDSSLVKLNMALLPAEVDAAHRPDSGNPARSFVLIDPFHVKNGVLELAATYIHELTHGKFYHERGFSASELIPLLSREEYVLVALDEELACFKNEVEAVKQFLASCPADLQAAAGGWVDVSIEPPAALYFSDLFASKPPSVLEDLSRQVVADSYLLEQQANYDRIRGSAPVPSAAAQAWVTSAEWTAIQGTLPLWQRAGVL
jgi:hypothetical protein